MITVISPAKKLNLNLVSEVQQTNPSFQNEANYLATTLRKLSVLEQRKLMSISEKLAELNIKRFQSFKVKPNSAEALPAVFYFSGDTYKGLEAETLENDELEFAQSHLRILSGLYGILKPFDSIQPYRLEMGSKLITKRGNSLYDFWGEKLSLKLNKQAEKLNTCLLYTSPSPRDRG